MKGLFKKISLFIIYYCSLTSCDLIERNEVVSPKATSNSAVSKASSKTEAQGKGVDIDSVRIDTNVVSFGQDTNVNVKEISDEFSFIDHYETQSGITIDWIKKKYCTHTQKG